MSILIASANKNGIVLTADSRITYNTQALYRDNYSKLLLTCQGIGIGISGIVTKDDGRDLKKMMINYINLSDFSEKTIEDVVNRIIYEFISREDILRDFRNIFFITGYNLARIPILYEINTHRGILELNRFTHDFVCIAPPCESEDSFINKILDDYKSRDIERLSCKRLIELSDKWVKESGRLYLSVGGPTDIISIRPHKSR